MSFYPIKLNNGASLPRIGLGTYKAKPEEVGDAVETAIDVGYRHIDCAWFHGNERAIGDAIRKKIADGVVKREDLFITDKLWNNYHEKAEVEPKLEESLQTLGLDYLDLYLIQWPFGCKTLAPLLPMSDAEQWFSDVDYLETWKAMEQAQEKGLTKSIGVSNFNASQIERLLVNCNTLPVVNQVECNPNSYPSKLIDFLREKNIAPVGYCPLGRAGEVGRQPGFPEPTIFDNKVFEIALKYNKTPAQVVLNHLVSKNIAVIPKSVSKSRILENFNIFDFSIKPEDAKYLDSLNKNQRICSMKAYAKHKYYPFNDNN